MGVHTDAYLFYGFELNEACVDRLYTSNEDEELDPMEHVEDLLKKAGLIHLGITFHCHHEYPIYFVFVERYTAWRGHSTLVPDGLTANSSWDDTLIVARDLLNMSEEEARIGWHLASYWG